jgi:hypothetical protein
LRTLIAASQTESPTDLEPRSCSLVDYRDITIPLNLKLNGPVSFRFGTRLLMSALRKANLGGWQPDCSLDFQAYLAAGRVRMRAGSDQQCEAVTVRLWRPRRWAQRSVYYGPSYFSANAPCALAS